MNIIQSGNHIVDQVGQMHFSGNVIPEAWYSTILYDNGKPNMNAIIILADIVYWYRPSEVRNEANGNIYFKKRFADKYFLQRSYQQISEKVGISKRQATEAIIFLEKKLGVIKRHFRTLKVGNGIPLPNVMFIELIPHYLRELTYFSNEDEEVTFNGEVSNIVMGDGEHLNGDSMTIDCETNTKITTKTTNKDYISLSINPIVNKIDGLREYLLQEKQKGDLTAYKIKQRVVEELKELIDYEIFLSSSEVKVVDALLEYMSEAIAFKQKLIFPDGEYDAHMLINQFYQLDSEAIRYVLRKFDEVSKVTKIKNKKNYLLRMLLTAKSDMHTSIAGDVNYDMAHWYEGRDD